jgi:putative ABC transport system substrate-binding protein
MRRREFISLVGGATAWPFAAQAQQAAAPIVGILGFGSLEAVRASFSHAQRRLAEIGYIEGRNLTLEYRGADSQEERLPALVSVGLSLSLHSRDRRSLPPRPQRHQFRSFFYGL